MACADAAWPALLEHQALNVVPCFEAELAAHLAVDVAEAAAVRGLVLSSAEGLPLHLHQV